MIVSLLYLDEFWSSKQTLWTSRFQHHKKNILRTEDIITLTRTKRDDMIDLNQYKTLPRLPNLASSLRRFQKLTTHPGGH